MDGYEHLGFLSSAPPDRSVALSCARCRVSWTGCADAGDCPRCGDDRLTPFLEGLEAHVGVRPFRIISGGQTGVDRAALDVALELGILCGGWCPTGRLAEDGRVPDRYPLREAPTSDYRQRTTWNVREADATLILHAGKVGRGTALTRRLAKARGEVFEVDLSTRLAFTMYGPRIVREWLDHVGVRVLNVAGPRESKSPGIGDQARAFLRRVRWPR